MWLEVLASMYPASSMDVTTQSSDSTVSFFEDLSGCTQGMRLNLIAMKNGIKGNFEIGIDVPYQGAQTGDTSEPCAVQTAKPLPQDKRD